jgi:WD40 repeat protein
VLDVKSKVMGNGKPVCRALRPFIQGDLENSLITVFCHEQAKAGNPYLIKQLKADGATVLRSVWLPINPDVTVLDDVNENLFATSVTDKQIDVWNTRTGRRTRELALSEAAVGFAVGPKSRQLVSIGANGRVEWWDLATWKVQHTTKLDFDEIVVKPQIRYSRDGSRCAVSIIAKGTWIGVFDTKDFTTVRVFGDQEWQSEVALSPNGTIIAYRTSESSIIFKVVASGAELCNLKDSTNRYEICFSPDGAYFACSTSTPNGVEVWQLRFEGK